MTSAKKLVQRFYRAVDEQRWDEQSQLVAPNFVAVIGSGIGLSQWQERLREFYSGFSGAGHVLDYYLAEGDRVVTVGRFEGLHDSTFAGKSRTGRRISVGVIHVDRVVDGKLVEHFGQLDALGLIHQIS